MGKSPLSVCNGKLVLGCFFSLFVCFLRLVSLCMHVLDYIFCLLALIH